MRRISRAILPLDPLPPGHPGQASAGLIPISGHPGQAGTGLIPISGHLVPISAQLGDQLLLAVNQVLQAPVGGQG